MKNNIKATLLLLFVCSQMFGQTYYIGYGPATLLTQQSVRLVNSKNDFSYSESQYLAGIKFNRKQTQIACQVVNYDATSKVMYSSKNGFGFIGCNITRLDLGLEYSILKWKIVRNISPFCLIGVQHSSKKHDIWDQLSLSGPEYFKTIPLTSRSLNTTQIVPSVGLDIGIKVLKGFHVSLRFQGVYGFKSFQNIYLSYRHVESMNIERQAVFDTRGTGLFSSLNINYTFKN